MTIEKAAEKLRLALDLCSKALEGETDAEIVEGLTFVNEHLRIALKLLNESRPAIPLDE